MSSPNPPDQPQHPPQPEQDKRTSEAKTAFTASLSSIGTNHDAPLRARASLLQTNAAALSKQETDVGRATEGLGRSNGELEGVADKAREGLKEIGDVQNWAEVIERELLVLEEVVRSVEEQDGEGSVDRNESVSVNGNKNGNWNAGGEGNGWLRWW